LAELLAPFCPEQGQRSIPRIRAVMGKTLKRGTDASLASTGISTHAQGTPPERVTTQPSPEIRESLTSQESPASSLTAQTWSATGTPGFKSRRPLVPIILAVTTVAALAIGATLFMGSSSPDEEADPAAVSENEGKEVPESEVPPVAPLPKVEPKAAEVVEAKTEDPAPEPAEDEEPKKSVTAPGPAPRAPAPQPRPVARPAAAQAPRPAAAPAPTPRPSAPSAPAPSSNPLDGRW
jgi:hypothetical protein